MNPVKNSENQQKNTDLLPRNLRKPFYSNLEKTLKILKNYKKSFYRGKGAKPKAPARLSSRFFLARRIIIW
jgi:hypothetical protein